MKRTTKGVPSPPPEWYEQPENRDRRFMALVQMYRKRWGSGKFLNELLGELTADEVALLSEAINHGVDPEAVDGYPPSDFPF